MPRIGLTPRLFTTGLAYDPRDLRIIVSDEGPNFLHGIHAALSYYWLLGIFLESKYFVFVYFP